MHHSVPRPSFYKFFHEVCGSNHSATAAPSFLGSLLCGATSVPASARPGGCPLPPTSRSWGMGNTNGVGQPRVATLWVSGHLPTPNLRSTNLL
mmetsp:Transcript_50271/g.89756  ORF Transcript_50271/g.89756 Transcript_50271/m.89756 type:complete len:93 (+) Transcript_50271:534-812(+)